ncbi:MAG: hypothetical protein EXS08_12610 [Planctomycetes bacterium]|nr:hypothetical protein [Planctomycetota bacterium]
MHSTSGSTFRAPTWDFAQRGLRVQVFGASGARGREIVLALLGAGHPAGRLALYARSPRTLEWHGERLCVETLPARLPPAELAFLCTPPEVTLPLAARLAAAGTRVVDLSGALALQPQSALVLAGVNDLGLGAFTEQVALPLPTTALIAPPLALLEREVGLAEVDLFLVVAAAHHGARGMLALREERARRMSTGGASELEGPLRVGNLRTSESLSEGFESRLGIEITRLLGRSDLLLDVTAWAGDVERSDVFGVKALLHAPLDPEAAAELFSCRPEFLLVPTGKTPTPSACEGDARLHVGRIRSGSRGPRSLCFCAAGDQLRAGSSHAALAVAARLAVGV